jgi:hypothetical protein
METKEKLMTTKKWGLEKQRQLIWGKKNKGEKHLNK